MTARLRILSSRRAHTIKEEDSPRSETALTTASPSTLGDLELIAGFLHGDPMAVGTISRWIQQAAGRYRNRLSTEWDDLLQDLLLEVTVVLQEGGFRGDCRLRTFVWRIAHYRCLNRIRDLARRPKSQATEVSPEIAEPSRPVIDRLVERESEDLLRRFLGTISDDCRRLWTSILAGRSYHQMSHETGISEGALRVRVLRCRQKALTLWKTWLESIHG